MKKLMKVKKELDNIVNAKERAIKLRRKIIPLCAQAIRDIQKKKYGMAQRKLDSIKKQIKQCEKILKSYPGIVNSMLGICYQEYAELSIFLSYMKNKKLPSLNIPAKYYLLGLGDAFGELKRVGMELLSEQKIDKAEKLLEDLEDLYFEFSQYVYPNSVVPGLKRKQDVARRVLNNLHEAVWRSK